MLVVRISLRQLVNGGFNMGEKDYGSIVRNNLMYREGYAPYCGNGSCMARAPFNGKQMQCPRCNWMSEFPADFIEEYKEKWKK